MKRDGGAAGYFYAAMLLKMKSLMCIYIYGNTPYCLLTIRKKSIYIYIYCISNYHYSPWMSVVYSDADLLQGSLYKLNMDEDFL